MADKKFKWINEDVIINFPVPRLLKNTMEEAEELDLAGNIEYTHVADAIDVICKGYVTTGLFTEDQWDKLVERYPVV